VQMYDSVGFAATEPDLPASNSKLGACYFLSRRDTMSSPNNCLPDTFEMHADANHEVDSCVGDEALGFDWDGMLLVIAVVALVLPFILVLILPAQ